MRAPIFALFLTACSSGLTQSVPEGVPSAAERASWEHFAGEQRLSSARVVYELWVNPTRAGLFEITRYRVFPLSGPPSEEPEWREVLIWNSKPGRGVPLLCFERVPSRPLWSLRLLRRWRWRAIPPGTKRYESEMAHARAVYGMYSHSLAGGE